MAAPLPEVPVTHRRPRFATLTLAVLLGFLALVAAMTPALGWQRSLMLVSIALPLGLIALTAASYAGLVIAPLKTAADVICRYADGFTDLRLDPDDGIREVRDIARNFNDVADRVAEREQQFLLVLEATGDVIWEWSAVTNSVVWTGELRSLFGIATDRFEAGSAWWHERVHPQDRERVEEHLNAVMTGTERRWSEEYRFRHEDGSYRWFWDRGVLMRNAAGEPLRFIGCMTDISAQRAAEEQIWQLANHDELTGLPNRKVFHSRLNALTVAPGEGRGALLLLIDLDHFKDVNDSLGHPAGDALLKAVSSRLKNSVGEDGEVFRLGGDEFAIILTGRGAEDASDITGKVLSALRDPVVVADRMLSTRATIGIVLAPDHGKNPAELLQNADLALYEGKSRGRNRAVSFEPALRAALDRRMTLLSEVRESLHQKRFVAHYQPIVSLRGGAVQGVEALMRWEHPDGVVRTPASFITAYEDPDLALLLFRRLIEGVVTDYRAWEDAGVAPGYVAINISSTTARLPDLAERLLARLAKGGMPASALCVELTETLLFGEHAELIGATVRNLHAAGVRIALDDFGTGYASLTHLQRFPVDAIKIDQSFIRSIATDPGSQAITSAVLELGRRLGKDVIAEGVETVEHAEILRAAGCRLAQGFYFARPMPADDLTGYMAARLRGADPLRAKAS